MFTTFAHAGEAHQSAADNISHSVLGVWYLALPLYLVILVLVVLAIYHLSGKSYVIAYNATLAILFISGVLGYRYSSAIAVVAISLGFAMALLSVLGILGASSD